MKNTHWWLLTFCCWSTHLPTISVRTSSRQDHLQSSPTQADKTLTQRVAINNNHNNTHLRPIFLTGTPSPSHERREWGIRRKMLTCLPRNEPPAKPTTEKQIRNNCRADKQGHSWSWMQPPEQKGGTAFFACFHIHAGKQLHTQSIPWIRVNLQVLSGQ